MRLGSLFSGIGGFEVAAQSLGWEVKFFSEVDPWCNAVLKKHWPDVPNLGDITTIDFSQAPAIDVLCGGFPCQDISSAGKGAGIEGTRSGLWSHYARAIDILRPKWVLIENVSILRRRGLDRVLRDLDALGYDAEWHCVPASAVGAPHQRDRIWIVAYPRSVADATDDGRVHGAAGEHAAEAGVDAQRHAATGGGAVGHTSDLGHERSGEARGRRAGPESSGPGVHIPSGGQWPSGVLRLPETRELGHSFGEPAQRWGTPPDVPGTSGPLEGAGHQRERCGDAPPNSGEGVRVALGDTRSLGSPARLSESHAGQEGNAEVSHDGGVGLHGNCPRVPQGDTHLPRLQGLGRLLERARERTPWSDGEAVRGYDGAIRLVAPGVPLLADGVPGRVGQIKSYGNAIVPHVALIFFQAIQEAEAQCSSPPVNA